MPNKTPKEINADHEKMKPEEQQQHKDVAVGVAETVRNSPASGPHKMRLDKRVAMHISSNAFEKSGVSGSPKPRSREHSKQSDYEERPPELLYCDPNRLEYYDDGSLRIFDEDIIKGIYIWAAEHGMERGWQNGDVIVNGRGC